jgi:hypothetical protein
MPTVNNEIVVEKFADTQETIIRAFTADELKQREVDYLAYQEEEANRLAILGQAQAKKQALLDRLGITAEEARLLLS